MIFKISGKKMEKIIANKTFLKIKLHISDPILVVKLFVQIISENKTLKQK